MFKYMSRYLLQPIRLRASILLLGVAVVAINLSTPQALNAHDEFKEVLERRYRLKSVSCKACHTDNKDKKIRNAFGKLLHEELKDKNLTQRYHDSKKEGEEAHKKFEKTMVKEFTVALKAVEKKPVTFQALMEAGLLNGTRLDKNQVDADALTIKTLSDAEVDAIKIENSSMIKGEIKEMPSEKDEPPTPKSEKSSSEENQKTSKPASKSAAPEAQPKSDEKPTDKPKPHSDDGANKSE